MKLYRGINDRALSRRARAVAIGVFDGVHRGHQKILKHMLREAAQLGLRPMVITFDPHPSQILKPHSQAPILMSLAHRLRLFKKLGVAETLVIRFDKKVAGISREKFLQEILLKKINMRSLTVGHDFRFGHKGAGNAAFLSAESKRLGFRLAVVEALKTGREIISSTRIRQLVERGELLKANKMLGRPVSVYGTVVAGRGRGQSIGFPTANLDPHHETLPPAGVYAATGSLGEQKLKGVIHIGNRPTFGDRQKSLEVHFLNFHKNIYGKELELIFLKRLRDIQKFKNPTLLQQAIRRDIKDSRAVFSS